MMKSVALSESCLYPTTPEDDFVIVEAPPMIPLCRSPSSDECEQDDDDENSYDYCEDVFGALDDMPDASIETHHSIELNDNLLISTKLTPSFLRPLQSSEHELPSSSLPSSTTSTSTSTSQHSSLLLDNNNSFPQPSTATTTTASTTTASPVSTNTGFPEPHQNSDDPNGSATMASHSPENKNSPVASAHTVEGTDTDKQSSSKEPTTEPTTTTRTTSTTSPLKQKRISNKKRRKQLKLARKAALSAFACAQVGVTNRTSRPEPCIHHQLKDGII